MKPPIETFKEDLKGFLKNLIVVLVTVLLVSKNISVAQGIFKINEGRVSWFLDVGIYTFITLLIISFLKLVYNKNVFNIECYFYYDKDYKHKEINLKPNKPEKVYFFISVRGSVKFMPKSIKISYSENISLQMKRHSAIMVDDENNTYTINLEKLFMQEDFIDEDYEIPCDLQIADELFKRKVISPIIEKKEGSKVFHLKKEIKDFTIKKKGSAE